MVATSTSDATIIALSSTVRWWCPKTSPTRVGSRSGPGCRTGRAEVIRHNRGTQSGWVTLQGNRFAGSQHRPSSLFWPRWI